MFFKSLTIVFIFCFANGSLAKTANVVFEQMSADFTKLEAAMQDNVLRVQDKEAEIIAAHKSKNTGLDLLGYTVMRSPVRVTAFRLQGVLRLLQSAKELSAKDKIQTQTLLKEIKSIEDAVGKMDEAYTTLQNAIKKSAPESKIEELRALTDKKSMEFRIQSESTGWLAKGNAIKSFGKIDFLQKLSSTEEIALFKKVIREQIIATQMEIKNELLPEFAKKDFSYDSMEHYFHEYRRQIRWIAIYFSSLPKLFSLTPYNLEGHTPEQQQILEKYKGNKYAEIASENSPIKIDRYTFYLQAHYIQLAGDSKDIAEEHFKLLQAGVESELDAVQFKKDMVQMMSDNLNKKIFETLIENLK